MGHASFAAVVGGGDVGLPFGAVSATAWSEPTFAVGTESFSNPNTGLASTWFPVMAYDANGSNDVLWIAALGVSGPYDPNVDFPTPVTIDEATGDIYVTINITGNRTGTTPLTVTAYDPAGNPVVSEDTWSNVGGGSTFSFEPFMAKFDQNGTPLWIRRLANMSVTNLTSAAPAPTIRITDASLDDYVIVQGLTRGAPPTGGPLRTIVFGQGDPGQQTYDSLQFRSPFWCAQYAKADGSIRAGSLEVQDWQETGSGAGYIVGYSASTLSSKRFASQAADRFSLPTSVGNVGRTPLARANTGSPVIVRQPSSFAYPGTTGYRAMFLTYDANSLAVATQPVVANNNGVLDDIAWWTTVFDDAKTFILGRPGPAPTNATDGMGTATFPFTGQTDAYVALYRADGTLEWLKTLVTSDTVLSRYMQPSAVLDDPANDRIFLGGYTFALPGTITFGPGEAGQVVWTLPSNRRHTAFWSVNRTTGDLNWVNTIENVDAPVPAIPLLRLEEGNLRAAFSPAQGDYRFDQINNPGGPITSFGDPVSGPRFSAYCLHDADTGAFVSAASNYEYPLESGLPSAFGQLYEVVGQGY